MSATHGIPAILCALGLAATAAQAAPDASSGGPVSTAPSRADDAQVAAQIEAFVDGAPQDAPPARAAPAPSGLAVSRGRTGLDDSPWGQGLYTPVTPGLGAIGALTAPSAEPPTGPRQIHGEVSAGVGTRGLREGSAAVMLPIGEDATLGLAVSSAHYGR